MRCLVLMMAASCSANGMYSSFLFFGGVVSSMVPSLSSLSSSLSSSSGTLTLSVGLCPTECFCVLVVLVLLVIVLFIEPP
jgi:hypothetical protein